MLSQIPTVSKCGALGVPAYSLDDWDLLTLLDLLPCCRLFSNIYQPCSFDIMISLVYNFDSCDADLILLSKDEVEFRVHRCILASASPFFEHMLRLPQPAGNALVPTIPVSEEGVHIDALLRFIYPIPDPILTTLDELSPILEAAFKYDFPCAIATLRKHLVIPSFLETSPTRVFAIASRFELEEEAQLASKYTLNINVLDCPLSDDLKHISAHSYCRLLGLHKRRAEAAQALLRIPDEVKCMQCNGHGIASSFAPPKWWNAWKGLAEAELAERPTSDVIFGMSFLAKAAAMTGCPRCAGSILHSHIFLQDLKRKIDELPATI